MDTAALKTFAAAARNELIQEVEARLTAVLRPGSPERVERFAVVASLEKAIEAAGGGEEGRAKVVDRAAYMWFNRIIALRFMDANGYTGVGVVSPAADLVGQPEVLSLAKRGQIDREVVKRPAVADRVIGLLNSSIQAAPGGEAQAEAYALLLTEYCRFWNSTMPFMFGREGDESELLIPSNLLAEGSVLNRAVEVLTVEACQDVEVIGWLYQFYISERKDEVFAGFKKNKKAGANEIPAATQLFTPHWIVRYLVENSIGRLWMLNHPDSRLVERMEYYIAPVEEETNFLRIATPEEITVIDPACGSGHMLTYAFDLLYAIYEEEGYAPSQIPSLILEKNLCGTEIDQRAGSLAAFALTMKAAAKRKLFLKKPTIPRICVLEPIVFLPDELGVLTRGGDDRAAEELFWNQFENADTFGSLIQPDPVMTERMAEHLRELEGEDSLFSFEALPKAHRVIEQAQYLLPGYSVVVANPPYMGSKQMNDLLSRFMKENYPDGKSDLFAAFIQRCADLAAAHGLSAMITMQSWMFLSSSEKLRRSLLREQWISSMIHLGTRAFDSIGGEVVSSTAFVIENISPLGRPAVSSRRGVFIRLVDGRSEAEKIAMFRRAQNARTAEEGFHGTTHRDFTMIPGSPIVYWLSERMREAFSVNQTLGENATLAVGLQTGDNDRFLREWWEVSFRRIAFACTSREDAARSGARWFPYNKGGDFRKWYGNQEFVVNWENDGAEIRVFGTEDGGRPRSRPQNTDTYFSPSVSWSDISSGEAAFRRYSAGFIHDSTGHSGFGESSTLDRVAMLMNSAFAVRMLQVLAPTMHFHIGYVGQVPVSKDARKLSVECLDELVETSKRDWDDYEISWNFETNPLVSITQEPAFLHR
ncbi:BREX-1 system adenine-specific DNA-methyltransferase PglX [Actinomyces sp. B33]|uniref:BREX-1 system adenine-specific DNA-methyltransferase PglX n=1 Tax=Actinomyces sp. B33 TaxID=2942131 RepID=UPI00233FFB2E|nr:BREX-1 system adenine-specific DNA-methyltransferase PglX [Actinomyces sp. B33]MDC4232438.1 BREX-1 system adenine-specific DNA-methyltransferase PglX [Actinomyces sp. B33]